MTKYRGRFAPSPTGPLHFGSLFAAVVSYLDARRESGTWLVRVEDIDPPREQPGASESILKCLDVHGLHADEPILYQSTRESAYEDTLAHLAKKHCSYRCPCSRKTLLALGQHEPDCIAGQIEGRESAIRLRCDKRSWSWSDGFQHDISASIDEDCVLKRRDNLYAYQLAVVVDDIDQNITHVVRGADLIDSTPMQLALYDALGKPAPSFSHFPLIKNAQGQKLSKQNLSEEVSILRPAENLLHVMKLIGIHIAEHATRCEDILEDAIEKWDRKYLAKKTSLPDPSSKQ